MLLCRSLGPVSLAQSHPGRACQCRVFQVLCPVSPAADASALARSVYARVQDLVCPFTLPVFEVYG